MRRGERVTAASPLPPAEILAGLGETAEDWGGRWEAAIDGGRLELPVLAGLRRGVVTARLSIRPDGGGSRLVLEVEESRWRVHGAAVSVLAMGAVGALAVTLWPFFPRLAALAPVGGFLAFIAWFLVVARLRTSGAEEFLAALAVPPDPGGDGMNHAPET